MITRYRVWLDEVALDSLADSIYITDIQEMEPEMEIHTMSVLGGNGTSVTHQRRISLQIRVSFQIREYNIATRREVFNKIMTWAQGTVLYTNERDGQQINVQLDAPPAMSALKWTETLTLSFTAWENPYWISNDATMLTLSGESVSGEITVDGNTACYPMFVVSNTGAAPINTVTITAGENRVRLEGINMLPEGYVYFSSHNGSGALSPFMIDDNGIRYLDNCFSDDSDDSLPVIGGVPTTILATADGEMTFIVLAQGVWL